MAADGAPSNPPRVSPTIPRALLRWLRRAAGIEAVRLVLREAGLPPDFEQLPDAADWMPVAEALALADATARVTGEPEVGRRAGEELLAMGRAAELSAFLVAEGSPAAALARAVAGGTRLSTVRVLDVVESGADHAVVDAHYVDPAHAHPFFCGMATGYYARLPELFGLDGSALETDCEGRGDDRCRYLVTWAPDTAARSPDVAASAARSSALIERFEQLQSMASRLATAPDIDGVVARIAELARLVVPAPRHLVIVRMTADGPGLVHHRGFDGEDDALLLAAVLEDGGPLPDEAVVVELRSPRRVYGRLVAMLPAESRTTEIDRRLLDAYAGHAAAALETIAALESARSERDTSRALLSLARSLAQVGTSEEVAQRIAAATAVVTSCDVGAMWLWSEQDRSFVLAGRHDVSGRRIGAATLAGSAVSGWESVLRDGRPAMVSTDTAPPAVRDLLLAGDLAHAAVVPVVARGTVFGTVTAGFRRAVPDAVARDLFEVLAGLADHAATALDNAAMVERIQQQALRDPLTGLPSRKLIEDRAAQALRVADRAGHQVGVLFVDLDRFKKVNDTLGHRAGDEIIRQVAGRLRGALRGSDTLGRLSGDEFVILLPKIRGVPDAVTVANNVFASLADPFRVDGQELFIACSVGIACAPEHGRDYATLMARADAAMYQAKAHGRSTYVVHAVQARGPRRELLDLETRLYKAVDNDELQVLYQPQVDLATMRLVGVEALVRWNHPDLGQLGPDAFLTLAEDTGLIVAIDAWVRHQALSQARAWIDAGMPPLRVAVNLSTRDLHRPELARELAAAIAAAGVAPSDVEVEITDRIVWRDEDLPPLLESLRDVGVRLAIDDFGTGSSVLGRLHRCPIDTLKIDRSFVVEAIDGHAPVLEAVVSLAHNLGLEVVAEGVETSLQATMVSSYGCDIAQGRFFGEPMAGDRIAELVRAVRRDPSGQLAAPSPPG